MVYHITRGGQSYGPYTLADLQRYVASGHILPTDLAKSDEMADWVPVSQILNPSSLPLATPPMASEYAAPQPGYTQPAYAAATGAYNDPPNLHWGLVLLFDVLTCSIFQIVWNFVIAAWVKRVQPSSQAFIYYGIGYGLALLQSGIYFPTVIATFHGGAPHTNAGLGFLGLISLALRIVGHFNIKNSLEQHFNTVEPLGFQMNGVLTFFFGGLYIQSQLNRINEIKQAIRYRDLGR